MPNRSREVNLPTKPVEVPYSLATAPAASGSRGRPGLRWGRGRILAALLAITALLPTGVTAAQLVDVFPPWGYSAGSVHPSSGSYCYSVPYTWQHSLAYSINTYSSPQKINFSYLDWYGGSTTLNPSVNYRYGFVWLVSSASSSATQISSMWLKPFNVYDVTVWLWLDVAWSQYHPIWVESNFRLDNGGGQFSYYCVSSSTVDFWPPGSY